MVGLVSFAAYIPVYRLTFNMIADVWGGGGKKGEKAVANFDEDSITMAVEAGRECLKGIEKDRVDALFFASTTPPYKEKQSASIVAAALDLREDIFTADITDSIRSGTIALKAALEMVKSGAARTALVTASDCRIAPPKSALESVFGDGAAAFLVGVDGVSVEIEASHYLTSEFVDFWRLEYDKTIRTWEDRFIRDEGYLHHVQKVVNALLTAHNLSPQDFARVVLNAPDVRVHQEAGKILGFDAKTQLQDPLFDRVGNAGVAAAPIVLVAALEEAKHGDRILLTNYGDGAEAHVLRITGETGMLKKRKSVRENLDSKLTLANYGKYLSFKELIEFAHTPEFRLRTSLPAIWRDRKWVYRFYGQKCKKCEKEQFPMQKHCMYCGAPQESLEEIPMAQREGALVTYSVDERAPFAETPNVTGAMSLGGGARFFTQVTDSDVNRLKVGMPMDLTFRRIHDGLGIHNYFWKCKPKRTPVRE